MKHRITNISIPKPCSEEWHNMLPDAKGKFCNSCQKTVTDFTSLSNTEILNLLSASDKVCGRFNETQLISLNNEIVPQHKPLFSWQKFSLAAAFIGFVPFIKVQAKVVKPPVEQGAVSSRKFMLISDTSQVYKKISGSVIDTAKVYLPGASVFIKGTHVSTYTDKLGGFSLNVPASSSLTLVVNALGYESQEIKIEPLKQTVYNFELKGEYHVANVVTFGEVMIKSK